MKAIQRHSDHSLSTQTEFGDFIMCFMSNNIRKCPYRLL